MKKQKKIRPDNHMLVVRCPKSLLSQMSDIALDFGCSRNTLLKRLMIGFLALEYPAQMSLYHNDQLEGYISVLMDRKIKEILERTE
jgi:hypothetical protein